MNCKATRYANYKAMLMLMCTLSHLSPNQMLAEDSP